jgi:hypothetical protein
VNPALLVSMDIQARKDPTAPSDCPDQKDAQDKTVFPVDWD